MTVDIIQDNVPSIYTVYETNPMVQILIKLIEEVNALPEFIEKYPRSEFITHISVSYDITSNLFDYLRINAIQWPYYPMSIKSIDNKAILITRDTKWDIKNCVINYSDPDFIEKFKNNISWYPPITKRDFITNHKVERKSYIAELLNRHNEITNEPYC